MRKVTGPPAIADHSFLPPSSEAEGGILNENWCTKLENIEVSIIDVYENESNEIRISNKDIALKWRIYHDKMASYRFLCGSCNSRFGAYV